MKTDSDDSMDSSSSENQYYINQSFGEAKSTNPRCLICDIKFSDKNELHSHHLAKHAISKCPKCGPAFRSMSHRMHHSKCGTTNVYKCPRCKEAFKSISQVRRHINEQHLLNKFEIRRIFMCEHCVYIGRSKSSIVSHLRRIHWMMFPDFEEKFPDPENEPHRCPFCDFCTNVPESLALHMKESYWNENRRSFVCPTCQASIKSMAGCHRHACSLAAAESASEYEDCAKCGRSFRKSKILHHQWICSSGSKNFRCSQCSFTTYCPSSVRSHFRQAHLTCAKCGKCLKNLAHMVRHKRVHTRPRLKVRAFSTMTLMPPIVANVERAEDVPDDSSNVDNYEVVKTEIIKIEDMLDNQ